VVGARLIGVWAAVALVLLAFASAAAGAEKSRGGAVAFELQGTNGYSLFILAGWNPQVPNGAMTIFVGNGRGNAVYGAPASVDEEGIEADLGRLGRISLRAERSGETSTAWSQCDKRHPIEYEPVTYLGEFEFRGEGGHTEASATRLPMRIQPLADIVCGAPGVSVYSGGWTPGAELRAVRHGRADVRVKADSNAPGKPVRLSASIFERRGKIRIERSVQRRFGASAFSYTPQLGTATLTPPAPFSGRGVFRRSSSPGHRWTGDLAVDFPGRPDVPLTGSSFGASLKHVHWSEGRG